MKSPLLLLIVLLSGILLSPAQAASIEGLWQQFDDSGQLNSLVRIDVVSGEARGTVIKGYPKPGKPVEPDARCQQCPGDFNNKPLIGLQFLWGLQDANGQWENGQILDPNNGKIYRAKATLSADGERLVVRGYLGVSLFGRSQTWRKFNGHVE